MQVVATEETMVTITMSTTSAQAIVNISCEMKESLTGDTFKEVLDRCRPIDPGLLAEIAHAIDQS